jgi:hypothetical protein
MTIYIQEQMKQITLSVPDSFVLPAFYSTNSELIVSVALSLGAEAYENLYTNIMDKARKETNSEIVARVSQDFAVKLSEMQEDSQVQIKRLRQEKQRYEEALNAMKHQLELHQQASLSVRADAQASAKASMNELLLSKNTQITRLENLLETQLTTVTTKVDSLQNSITKTFSSSRDKGAYGELLIEGLLKKAFDCEINIVSKEAQHADIRMIRNNGIEYFWEAKNYTRMVSSEEVEKFRRDMRLHPKVLAGCLVSLRTGIVGHSRGGDIDVEFLEDGRCILFISNFLNRDDPIFYLQTLRPFFEILEANVSPVKEDSEIVRGLEAKGLLIANLLRNHTNSVAKHRNSIINHKKRIDTMFVEFQGYILEAETQLQTLLRISLGNEETISNTIVEVETELPERIFKKPRLSDYQERHKEFISWLLTICKVNADSQVEIKQLIEYGKEMGFSEKWIRDLREELFQESSWLRGSRYINGLKLN